MEDLNRNIAHLQEVWQREASGLEKRGLTPWTSFKYEKYGIEDGRSSAIRRVLACFPEKILNNPKFVSQAISTCHPYFLEHLSRQVQDDFEHVLRAVEQYGESLEYASERLRNNDHLIATAVEQSGLALEFVSHAKRDNREIVLSAVRQNGLALKYASPRMKKIRGVVLEAIQRNDDNLFYDVWNGHVVVSDGADGMALQFAHEGFWNDEQIVRTALSNGAEYLDNPFKWISQELQGNREFVKWALGSGHIRFDQVSNNYKSDEELALLAISNDASNLDLVSDDLKHNKKFVLKAVKVWGTLRHVPTHFLEDSDVVMAANSKQVSGT